MTYKETITLLGAGDITIEREQPETIFQHVAKTLHSGDIVYANCEQAFSDKRDPGREHGLFSDPRNIPALSYAGINVVSQANNHSQDWGKEALLDTMDRLKKAGISCVGVGKNLAEARQPVILERKGAKVGFLAYSSVHPKGFEAEKDKPGLAPVRVWTFFEKIDYQPGTPPQIITIPYKEDLAAMVEDIKKLRQQVDVVVVSFHWGQHFLPRIIPMYCFEVGHAAVDAGADLILGTHTHILKGIEVYKGKVIFYSTGNFATEVGPRTLKGRSFGGQLAKHYRIISDPEYPTYPTIPESRATLIVKAIIEAGEIKRVTYIPCYVNKQAEPEIVTQSNLRGQEVYRYMEDISRSEDLPVHFSWGGNEVLIKP